MKTLLKTALTITAVGLVASAIVHRKALAACVKGEPLPEPPAWHKKIGLHK